MRKYGANSGSPGINREVREVGPGNPARAAYARARAAAIWKDGGGDPGVFENERVGRKLLPGGKYPRAIRLASRTQSAVVGDGLSIARTDERPSPTTAGCVRDEIGRAHV